MHNDLKIKLTPQEYDFHKKECDGICNLCKSWGFGNALPDAQGVWCTQCENRSMFGVKAALESGLVEVR